MGGFGYRKKGIYGKIGLHHTFSTTVQEYFR